MDEEKGTEDSVAKSNLEESTVNVSEHVAGESEARVESMVEFVGSHVSVHGECTNDGGGRGGGEGNSIENSNDEVIHDYGGLGEAGLERDLRGADDGNDVVADPGSRETDVSSGEASVDSGFGTEGGGPLVEERVAGEIVEREMGGGDVVDDSGFQTEGGGPLVEEGMAGEIVEREKGGGDVVDEMPKGDVSVSNDGVLNGGIESRIEGSTAVLGSTDGETEVCMEDAAVITSEEGLEGESIKKEDRGGEKVGSTGGEAQDHGFDNGVRSSTVVSSTLDGKTPALVVEEVTENENASGRELVKGAEQGRETDAGEEDAHQDGDMQEVIMESENTSGKKLIKSAEANRETDAGEEGALQDADMQDVIMESENASEKELIKSAEANRETDAGEEDARQDAGMQDVFMESENASEKELIKSAEANREADAGEEDAHQDADMQDVIMESENASGKELIKSAEANRETDAVGEDAHQDIVVLDDKIWNPKIETAVTGSSGLVEDSSVQTQVVEEAAVVFREEVLNVKDDDLDNSDLEGFTSNSEEKQIPMANTDDGQTRKSIVNANPKSLEEQTPAVAVSGEVTATDKGEFLCSTVEGMETDTFDENLSFSLEELQGNIERVDGSTENHSNVCADATSSCQPTQVVGDEVAATVKNVHPDSENNQQLKPGECLDEGTAHDVARVDSNKKQAMEIDEQVVNSEFEGALSGSENVQNLEAETVCMGTEIDTHDDKRNELVDNQEALNSNVEVEGHADKGQDLKNEESLAAEQQVNNVEEARSDGGRQIGVQKQPITFGKVGGSTDDHTSDLVSTGQPTDEVVEGEVMAVDDKVPSDLTVEFCSGDNQSLKAEEFGGNAEMDSRVMNGGETALQASEEKVEGLVPAEGDKTASVNSTVGQDMQIEEQVIDAEQDGSDGGPEMQVEEQDSDTEQPKTIEEEKPTIMKAGSSVQSHQTSYQLLMEDEGEFKVSDLVWGKVRSHPWWPGQIYDPSDASEKSMKYHKKDCFLVAYFGDRTFAWVDASLLKPFYSHFSQVEKQSNSEVFQNAVNCALEEVSRRVELGLACSCIPNDTYDNIRFQMVENTGIRQESSTRDGMGDSVGANSFQPDTLIEYMKALAQSPSDAADRLELVIAKAQLSSFYRLKGYCQLPEFQTFGGLVENGVDDVNPISKDGEHISSGKENLESQRSSYNKRKHNLKDCMYPSKKERSLSELMSGSFDSLDDEEFGFDEKATSKLVSPSGKKRKAVDSIDDDSLQDGRKTISLAKVSITTPQVPKPSFKIGECIRRAASQMTASPSILKSNSERFQKFEVDGPDVSFENFEDVEGKRMVLPTDYSSLDDLLSQLHLAARDPMKGYSFLNIITSFFSDFRNSIIPDKHSVVRAGGKRKKSSHSMGTPETFEFEDMNDTYWTDRVIQNGAEEEQPSGGNGRGGYKIVPVELGKPVQKSRRSYTRKQYSDVNHDAVPAKPPGYVDENAPAELVMNFSEVDYVPSETNLNKMFRRFGPIKESETEVDRETNRARVVFKRCADAEIAYSSAAKFSIFGPMVVNYQLGYSISVPFKASSIALTLGEDMHLDIDTLGV
ncbi:hypothetical protein JRO89_XS14G0044600 [Xanthoceras sorbifolium]|uniref:PWWP domain-containing protein n=1 Tax=Xanthoceras sorbifolium TaxID=99658 RepID=A0ABQ8H3U4_9ROSI|nr:hypothetical protein JRO89_XS14G0044600 [Xanthoceras sorbifolium]